MEEKDIFEKGEELEIEIEPMEIDVMSKEERLSRMSSMMKAWEAGKICKEIVLELAEGMEKAVEKRMIEELIEEITNNAADSGDLNIMLKDIISRGQVARDIVEQRLRY